MWNVPTVQKYLDVLAIFSKLEVRSTLNATRPSNANHAWLKATSCVALWGKQTARFDVPRPRAVNHTPPLEAEPDFNRQALPAFAADDCVEGFDLWNLAHNTFLFGNFCNFQNMVLYFSKNLQFFLNRFAKIPNYI